MVAMVLSGTLSGVASGQEFQQSFRLRPGWNSIYLEVAPVEKSIEAALAGLPVESVLRSAATESPVDFVRNPDEKAAAGPAWLRYQPGKAETTLFSLEVHTAYLIKVSGDEPVILTVPGRPTGREKGWRPNAWNLRGFPIDPERPPTFASYFETAAAHDPEKIRRLSTDGTWKPVAAAERMVWGEAYLVFSDGASTFTSPLEVVPATGDGVDFHASRTRGSLQLVNRRGDAVLVELADVAGDQSFLVARQSDERLGFRFDPLTEPADRLLEPRRSETAQIGISRRGMTGDRHQTVLEVSDRLGTRHLIPVSATRSHVAPDGNQTPASFAGLWVGVVSVDAVQEVQAGVFDAGTTLAGGDETNRAAGTVRFVDPRSGLVHRVEFRAKASGADLNGKRIRIRENTELEGDVAKADDSGRQLTVLVNRGETTIGTMLGAINRSRPFGAEYEATAGSPDSLTGVINDELSPVSRPFQMRVLIHVDSGGQARLLKEVFQMWQDGRRTGGTDSGVDPENPGQFVLITDKRRLDRYSGATLRAGVPVGRRISAVGFDFDGTRLDATDGHLQPGRSVNFVIELAAKHPTNPFFHRYHPDHGDNTIQVMRSISLAVLPSPRAGTTPLDYGYSTLSADWQETIVGLHRASLTVSGDVSLRRLSLVEDLVD